MTEELNVKRHKTRWNLFIWFIAALLLLSATLAPVYLMFRPALPTSTLNRIHIGMSKHDVRTILGEPRDINKYQWTYSRFGNNGWVAIMFDEKDKVLEINDESAFVW